MRLNIKFLLIACGLSIAVSSLADTNFQGRIFTTMTRGAEVQTVHYTFGTNCIRIERGESNWPHAKNLIARDTGALTLLFPHNRSFVRLPAASPAWSASPAGISAPGSQSSLGQGASVPMSPTNLPGMPAPHLMPAMPSMAGSPPGMPRMPAGMGGGMPAIPMMPMEQIELKATGESTNILGYQCERFELAQRGETMEIWATDQLPPYQPWMPNQSPRFGPRMLEEQWGEALKMRKLFPLRAVLRFGMPSNPGTASVASGPERLRFEVKSITPENIEDKDGSLFQPPAEYQEIQPLPF